jgi:uncharacterized membrane protein YoaK (UPF0700 family)
MSIRSSATTPQQQEPSLTIVVRRVTALAAIAGCVEAIGFMDLGGMVYPGIMTGNTVQLGLSIARAQWASLGIVALAIGLFVLGGILSSLITRGLRQPLVNLVLIAVAIMVAGFARIHVPARVPVELPLLAFAMAMQGDSMAKFGAVSLQTIVVTSNMVRFSDALVGRYLCASRASRSADRVPAFRDVLLPGLAWLGYSAGACAGAAASFRFEYPLLIPSFLLLAMVGDLLWAGQ